MAYMTMVTKPWIFGSDGTFPALISAQNRDLDIQKQHLKYVVIWQPFFNTHRWSFECVFFVIYYFRNSMDEERFLNHTFLLSQHCTIDKLRPINPIWHRPQTTYYKNCPAQGLSWALLNDTLYLMQATCVQIYAKQYLLF